jgi:hypothetical protein
MHSTPLSPVDNHAENTSYFDDGSNFFTGTPALYDARGEWGSELRGPYGTHIPSLLEPVSRFQESVDPNRPKRLNPEVGVAARAGAIDESPGDVAIKNLLLLNSSLPVEVETPKVIVPRTKTRTNEAKQKWGIITFHDPEAVKFRQQLNKAIMDHRVVFAQCNSIVRFPEKVPNEALGYSAPRFGPEWETFDATKHADYEATERIRERKVRLEEVKAAHKKSDEDRAAKDNPWEVGVSTEMDDDDEGFAPLRAALPDRLDDDPENFFLAPTPKQESVSSPDGKGSPSPHRKYEHMPGLLPERKSTVNLTALAPFFRSGYQHFDAKPAPPDDINGKKWGELYDDL